MKVFPDTTLKILTGCPCDPDYEHTLYFTNETAQRNYFASIAKYTVNAMSYQRAKRGRIRVQYKVENLYDCNYIMFQNTAFGDKWFYAFIDDVTYVNNITSEISYTIDVMQTWLFDMQLQQCFVEREHSVTDEIGDNLLPEDVYTGEMVGGAWANMIPVTGYKIVMAQAYEDSLGDPVDGGFYGNVFNQIKYVEIPATADGIANLKERIKALSLFNNNNAILSIFMCPINLTIPSTSTPTPVSIPAILPQSQEMLTRSNGAAVKNKKLNTYPFTYMAVTNCNGGINKYAYEYFDSFTPAFDISAAYTSNLSLVLVPKGYKTTGGTYNPVEMLNFDAFPECMWGSDGTANRVMTAALSAGVGAISGALQGGAIGAVAGGLLGAAQGGLSGNVGGSDVSWELTQPLGAREDVGKRTERGSEVMNRGYTFAASVANSLMRTPINPMPENIHGGSTYPVFNASGWGFRYTQMRPLPQFIDRIDDYFSRYGYKTNSIKVPNISSRPHWNYTQTIGCKISGSIPCQDEKLICSIFDKGVTFWKNPSEVGNYSLDNSPM